MHLLQKLFGSPVPKAKAGKELPVENPLIAAYNKTRNPEAHHSACYAPSVNMIFSEDGTVRVCCHNRENLLGIYPEKTIHELWHGTDAVLFRKKMQEFQFLSGCWGCARDYDRGRYEGMPARHFDSLPRHNAYPTMMEFLLSNTCNLECVMCCGELSSAIRANREKLPLQKSPYGMEFISQMQEFIPYLKETRFASSGEAFLIHLNYKLWESLIEKNPECLIVVQTNGTIMNARVKDFLERGNFKIGVSVDSLKKDVYEAIRLNASFDEVMENIRYFADYSARRNKTLTISTCVMRQNWKELPDFIHFSNSIGAMATFHKVMTPLQFAIHNLPQVSIQHIFDELSAHQFPAGNSIERINKEHYEYFVSVIGVWAKDAGKRQQEPPTLQKLTMDELLSQFTSNMRTYVLEQNMIEKDRVLLAQTSEKKIHNVLALFENDTLRKGWLLLLCAIPMPNIFPAIKNLTMEKLYELSLVRVKDNQQEIFLSQEETLI